MVYFKLAKQAVKEGKIAMRDTWSGGEFYLAFNKDANIWYALSFNGTKNMFELREKDVLARDWQILEEQTW